MKVFLSYSSAQRPLAEKIVELLDSEGHDVFFDRDSLQAGETFDQRIRKAIGGCQLFIFLVSAESVKHGSYTRTELALVEMLDDSVRPAILPVLVAPLDLALLPAFLSTRTVYQPSGYVPAEVAAQVDLIRLRLERPAPRLIATPSNQSWDVYIDLANEPAKEIFYRVREQDEWTSTGFAPARSFSTGKPLPRGDIALSRRRPPEEIFVKYVDVNGREHGPYRLPFEPMDHFLRFCREVLRTTNWVAFREWPEGHLLVYFTHILSYKDAYSAIHYSIDDASLSRRLRFKGDPKRLRLEEDEKDESTVEVPLTTQSVCVQVHFVDGTASEARTFTVADLGIDR
jgi:TIR domain